MEYLKIALTYIAVGIIFDIPLFVRGMKTKDFSGLKYSLKFQAFIMLGILLATFTVIYLLKIDTKIFNIASELLSAIMINIVLLFFNKK